MKLLANKTNVEPVDAVNLYGQLKNDTGSGDGTPADVELLADGAQFFERLFAKSGLTANGLPDNETNSYQLYEALRTLFPLREVIVALPTWDMDTVASIVINLPTLDFTKIRDMSAIIENDAGGLHTVFLSNGGGTIAADEGTNNITLARTNAGIFDGPLYAAVVNPKGFLTVRLSD